MNNIIFTHKVGDSLKEVLNHIAASEIFILADKNSAKNCLPLLPLEKVKKENIIIIEGGENNKTISTAEKIWNVLSTQGAKRNSVLINVGGGLVTDVGGFAASCFKRGTKCINIPTTLLAQVDASVGGKTGVNFNGLKNEIGTFSIPDMVIIDTCFLKSLPYRQVLSGFAEMIKHGLLLGGEHFYCIMEINPQKIDWDNFLDVIRESVSVKDKIVQQDPTEKGVRKSLNLGHTIGHALESLALERGEEFYHGEAVAYGIIAELALSVKKVGFSLAIFEEVKNYIKKYYPPCIVVENKEELYELMLHDKKNEKDGVNFTLLKEPGKFIIDNYCRREEIIEALEYCF
ncbi:MAG: 3-dehydroquinate synthase [Odoribacter sp.]|nr:3-dehydroquinate synthase [Odoribacter sp.]